ncbi:SUMO ligase siz1 [Serendipita sp. 399]|nr:SUMO ligase siz1 [Serendipita sp. 399]
MAELRNLTVNYLKSVIHGLSDENVATLSRTGKKAELQDRIVRALRLLQSQGQVDKWVKARAVILQAVSGIEYDSSTLSRFMNTAQSDAGPSNNASASVRPSRGYGAQTSTPSFSMPNGRAPGPMGSLRPNLHQSVSSSDRRTARFNFYLTNEQWRKLNESTPCPIEFPPTCEVRINNQVLSANFRGIKKKAGTAPPANITQLVRAASGQGNQVEMIYVNSSQPNTNKQPIAQKYYLVVNLVEVTSVKELVERLRNRVLSKAIAIQRIQSQQSGDDEVQMGPTKLSLRDPVGSSSPYIQFDSPIEQLTYTRLRLPCRASTCVHIGCFDASCWYSMMEQTTTWLCPICDRTLDVADLVIDEYVSEILESVPEDVDDVMVEADGEWHTEDKKYGSPNWTQKFGIPIDSKPVVLKVEEKPRAPQLSEPTIEIGDSDSEEEYVKQEVASSSHQRSQPSSSLSATPLPPPVIDLTLDDSDEEGQIPARPPLPPMPASSLGKRKLSSDGDLAGSSRRTSTAASHRSARPEDDDTVSLPLLTHLNGHTTNPYGPLRSPTTPFGPYHSPTLYKPNVLPSPTARSPPSLPHNPQWTQPSESYRSGYSLPPASLLLIGSSPPNPSLTHPLPPRPQTVSSHLPPPPAHFPRQSNASQFSRPAHNDDRPQSMHRSSSSGSSASRYAEWGLGSNSFT